MHLTFRTAAALTLAAVLFSQPAMGAEREATGRGVLSRMLEERNMDRLVTERVDFEESLRLTGERIENPSFSYSERLAMNPLPSRWSPPRVTNTGRANIALAVLASAVLPGMGELYVWYGTRRISHLARAPIFLALDAWFWYSYDHNHAKGKEVKAAYERFCDAHWSEERFLQQHPYCYGIGGCDSWQQYNEEARGDYYYFVYIPRNLDHEEYYENCGKYDAFAFGWDDWNGDYDNFEPWTPNRTKYWALRNESDDYLIRGDQFLMALIVNRVVSMLDAGWLAYKAGRGDYDDAGWSLDIEPGRTSSSLGISYRF